MTEKKCKITKPTLINHETECYYNSHANELNNITKDYYIKINNFLKELEKDRDSTEEMIENKINEFVEYDLYYKPIYSFLNIHMQYLALNKILENEVKINKQTNKKRAIFAKIIANKVKNNFEEVNNTIPEFFKKLIESTIKSSYDYDIIHKNCDKSSKKKSLNPFNKNNNPKPQNDELITYDKINKEFDKTFNKYYLAFE